MVDLLGRGGVTDTVASFKWGPLQDHLVFYPNVRVSSTVREEQHTYRYIITSDHEYGEEILLAQKVAFATCRGVKTKARFL